MDDLIIPSVDYDSGIEKLERVLKTASRNGLIINWKKCNLLHTRIDYLSHIMENAFVLQSVRPRQFKKFLKSFPTPINVRQIQQFLGLTGYFRKFIPGYSIIARPFTNLMKKEVDFKFESLEESAFNQLKSIPVDKPVLNLYKVGAETELHRDASSHGYGAILL